MMNRQKIFYRLFFIFLAYHIVDVVTTLAFTSKHGFESEGNFILRKFLLNFGYWGFPLYSLLIAVPVLFLWLNFTAGLIVKNRKYPFLGLFGLLAYWQFIIFNNFFNGYLGWY